MKISKKISVLLIVVMLLVLTACGSSNSPESTYKKFLHAAEQGDIKTYYSLTEAGAYIDDDYKEYVKNLSKEDFYKDVEDYFQWVADNDDFRCREGIKKIKIHDMQSVMNGDDCTITASVTITTKDKLEYDLNLKTYLFLIDNSWYTDY